MRKWRPMRTSRFRAVALLVVPALMSCRAATEVGVTGDDLIFLDAETLAEGGIAAAHAELLAEIRAHAPGAEPIEERLDAAAGRYAVSSDGREYVIYAPGGETEPGESWARATHALFEIVNEQLAASQVRFYAINGGNDLAGR
ncbi:MAG: hypothetical protein OEP45_09330, partial [Acidobacteriota bacterium]|nr:hypothetical protein [Acidobacteriota bacterium]